MAVTAAPARAGIAAQNPAYRPASHFSRASTVAHARHGLGIGAGFDRWRDGIGRALPGVLRH
jgi:hypothetical protein